jgi:hypothetical protein
VNNTPPIEQRLLIQNVNDHVEKKQNLTYLSWAWAWAEALKADPAAQFRVRTFFVEGIEQPFMTINNTAMVWVEVTLGGRSRECFLPVMDHRNKPIQAPDAFQVNTALMRCLTKCLALFGLGLYIYAGEDLPEGHAEIVEAPETKSDIQEVTNSKFFAEKLLQTLSMHETERDLRDYWKVNQEGIDKLKRQAPEVFKMVQKAFADAKQRINQGDVNE